MFITYRIRRVRIRHGVSNIRYTCHAGLAARKQLFLADSLFMRFQPSLRDRFHIMETQYIIAQPSGVHYNHCVSPSACLLSSRPLAVSKMLVTLEPYGIKIYQIANYV